ncbi:MAG: CDP-2,3-bis-(O-geranylgeranyl)-sn-glycerol synthase [Candidatus Diapherotrites archaeon]|nr:CDP-2,3-bis-(O-geranylgeranyl)-sn-glycerol synthase [Candidatus Diapherotrites archaeon]
MSPFDPLVLFLLYLLPMYAANSIPVIVHGKTPLDFNFKLFGKPLFGKGKTIVGTFAGIIFGTIVGAVILLIFPYSISIIPEYLSLAFGLALGAIIGDLFKSFFKRRFGIKSGEKWDFADQLDFILGGLIISSVFRVPEWWIVIALVIMTFFIHSSTNWVAYSWQLKKVPW